jgi:hypothetical protein
MYRQLPDSDEVSEKLSACESRLKTIENKIADAKKKQKIKIMIIAAAVAVVLIGASAFLVYQNVLAPNKAYNAALQLQQDGKYDEAVVAFEAMGNYKDSEAQVQQSLYLKAHNYLSLGQYDDAIEQFKSLGDYSDSAEMVKESTLQKATEMYSDKATKEDAILLLETIGSYGDADKLALSWRYDFASYSQSALRYEQAFKYFASVPGYKDADEKRLEVLDTWIDSCLSTYEGAAEKLMSVVPHNDDLYNEIYKVAKERLMASVVKNTSKIDDGLWSVYYNITYGIRSESFEYFMNQLPSSYDYSDEMAAFVRACNKGIEAEKELFSDKKTVKALYDNFPAIRDCFETGGFSYLFFYGNWTTSDGAYYLRWEDSKDENYMVWCSYTLPAPAKTGREAYWGLYDHTMVWLDKENNVVSKLYDFEFVDYDTMRVHCYQNDRTYTLTR